jgi:hypothetical protein
MLGLQVCATMYLFCSLEIGPTITSFLRISFLLCVQITLDISQDFYTQLQSSGLPAFVLKSGQKNPIMNYYKII